MMQMTRSGNGSSTWQALWRRLGLGNARSSALGPIAQTPQRGGVGADRVLQILFDSHPTASSGAAEPVPAPREAERPASTDALPQVLVEAHNGRAYRTPTDLQRTEQPIRRVLVIGSCLSGGWIEENRD
jgi:hypothetical protein